MTFDQALSVTKELKSQDEVLQSSYDLVTSRFQGKRFHTFWTAIKFFGLSTQELWRHPGYMDCLHQNKVMRDLLIKSGKFKKQDIKKRWTLYWGISPHQYLKVKTERGWLEIDTWSAAYGIELGDYGRWFHTKSKE